MDKNKQQKLYDSYPDLFVQKDWDKRKTCMCWGICCGDGWYGLIDRLCREIMNYVECENEERKKNNKELIGVPQFSQIKEKFGLLRIYMDASCDDIEKIVNQAETASQFICEDCGTSENTDTYGGWILTLCNKCRKNRNKINYFYKFKLLLLKIKRYFK